jgi:hypothetical protein
MSDLRNYICQEQNGVKFLVLREKKHHTICYSVKLYFKNEQEILFKNNLRDLLPVDLFHKKC